MYCTYIEKLNTALHFQIRQKNNNAPLTHFVKKRFVKMSVLSSLFSAVFLSIKLISTHLKN